MFDLVAAPPAIPPFQFPQNLQVDQRISVLCQISVGDRPAQFAWLKDGSMVAGASFPNIRILDNAEFSTLLIDPITLESAGNYTCSVTNKAGHTSFTAPLVVHGTSTSSFLGSHGLACYSCSRPCSPSTLGTAARRRHGHSREQRHYDLLCQGIS